MDKNTQIMEWYRGLSRISQDDKADFDVMLLDHKNPTDATSAMLGIALNLSERGVRYDIMSLLFDAAKTENSPLVQQQAISNILTLCWICDDTVRQDKDLQESLLDMIADHTDECMQHLHFVYMLHNKNIRKGHIKNLNETLIYRLIVVGEKAQEEFKTE